MIVQVKIDEQTYVVEISDIHARPVCALVNGEPFEIWPESNLPPAIQPSRQPAWPGELLKSERPAPVNEPTGENKANSDQIKAPIPGVILSVAVRPGEEVHKGQELCVLEAMKMKNLIRSPKGGAITDVHVIPGQTVSHGDLLFEFGPSTIAKA